MGIQPLNFNNVYNSSDRRKISVPIDNDRRLIMRDSSNIFPNINYTDEMPQNKEVRAFLPQNQNTSPQNDNFFLKQSDYQINPFECTSTSMPKPFVLSTQPEFGMKTENQMDKTKDTNPFMRAVECTFTPFRRAESVPDEIKKGNLIPALGAIGLTAINFPEDWSDIKTATHQISSYLKGEKYEGAYNYLKSQHEFSFFRGTLLGWMVDEKKYPKMAKFLQNLDKSLVRTSFGKKLLSLLNVMPGKPEKVKRYNKDTNAWELAKDINGKQRYAFSREGKWFGEITSRALSRTTLIGTGIFALMELCKITKAATKGDTIGEKATNGAKQSVKSGINLASMTAGIAYVGAIGAKYKKGFGSLVGMGVGAALGGFASNKLQDMVN